MTIAGWVTMVLCWSFVTGFSVFLIVRTLREPRHSCARDASEPQPVEPKNYGTATRSIQKERLRRKDLNSGVVSDNR